MKTCVDHFLTSHFNPIAKYLLNLQIFTDSTTERPSQNLGLANGNISLLSFLFYALKK
jgi:hypothetical protein